MEQAAAAAAWIGPAGGTISATASDGTVYQLDFPEYAVFEPTAITMTPISAVDGLGLSGGLAGAVYLQPAGLALAVPATLQIETSRTAPAGTTLVGIDAPDDGAATDLVPVAGDGGEITVPVFHFSAPGAAYGTPADLATISQAAIPTRLSGLLTLLLADPVPWDITTKGANGLLIDFAWAGSPLQAQPSGLRQAITDAGTDAALLQVVKDWRTFVFALNLYAHDGDAAAAIAEGDAYPGGVRPSHTVAHEGGKITLARQFKQAIDGNKALCTASHDLRALANVWFWAGLGQRYAPDERDWLQDARGCAELAVDVANLPTNLAAGSAGSLSISFVLKFTDGTRVPADVEATLGAGNFSFVAGGGQLVAPVAGGTTMTAGVTAVQGPPYALTVSACWYLGGMRRNLCGGPFPYQFGSGQTAAPTPGGSAGSEALAQEVVGTYAVRLICGNLSWGEGTAVATASGGTVSVSWSISTSLPTTGMTGGLCRDVFNSDRFPTSGSFSGTVVERPSRFEILLSSWQATPCVLPDDMPEAAYYYRSSVSITIPVGRCVPGLLGDTTVSGSKT